MSANGARRTAPPNSLPESNDRTWAPVSAHARRRNARSRKPRRGAHGPEPERPREWNGRDGPDPVRYGDWEVNWIASDFLI